MKKIVLASLILSMVGMAFALPSTATSKKNDATKGLFTTDVDNFSDVNGWSTVNPEKIFGFLGYNGNGIDYGMSHQFNKFYGAFYFNGLIDSFEASTSKSTPKVGDSTTEDNAKVAAAGEFNTAFLFGTGDLGIKLDFKYKGYTTSNSTETKASETTKSGRTKFDLFPVLTVGLNNKAVKSWAASYKFYAGYDGHIDMNYQGKSTKDDSYGYIEFGGAMNLNKDAEKANHNWNLGLNSSIGIYPTKVQWDDKVSTTQDGKGYFKLDLVPNYTFTYKATDKVTLKVGAGATVGFDVTNSTKTTSTDGNKVYNANPSTSTNVYISNTTLKTAMVVTPEFKKISFPVDLNFGASFTVPTLNLKFNKTETVDTAKGDVYNTTDSTKFNFYRSTGAVTFGSGFTAQPLSFLTLDASYNIVADIFGNDFSTGFSTGNGTNFWNTVNQVLVHNVTILASVKF